MVQKIQSALIPQPGSHFVFIKGSDFWFVSLEGFFNLLVVHPEVRRKRLHAVQIQWREL